ncbi:hypothetical protein H6G00_05140 [Leptolyngbya sp. FACHB-541]|uniref:hypothetical protein n=1 Tax=Leptolyngbya sp. FACHB-541 TaxID=2692810 RepID=UPI0016827EB1|nr:hypothetical protein [Leptolyngbya sp. FACHB-541]MBD1996001.1 hypothetical protein [Leptolyngbya sp. FACHB-541]
MSWNITPPTDLERLRKHLKVPAEQMYLDILRISMERVERESPDTVYTIQEQLDQLDQLKIQKSNLVSSGSYGLTYKKVDVLEWEWGGGDPSSGVAIQEAELVKDIATALHIELPESNGYGTLGRS